VRRRGRIAAACLATVLGPAVVAHAAGSINARPPVDIAVSIGGAPAPLAPPVPGDRDSWLALARRAAASCPGLSSAVLVAMGSIETGLGMQTATSPAGAVGPMQFLPSTWAAYASDGDGDGISDVMNPADAMQGAARLLCANGGADAARLPSAIWNYNHSDDYVRQVLALARFTPN
jgi:membrane-bound lytic murein transglycosylase B